jgi:SH3-like domain-containing protein
MLPPPPPPWRRTHVVPAQGISAWAIPDGRAAPVATLPAGVQLELTRMQGPWAEVVASNGWRGWVDPSVLLPAPPG